MMLRTFALLIIFASSAQAETVSNVLSGNTVQLDDKRIVRLYGITTKPDEGMAIRFLQEWTKGKNLKIELAPDSADRHNNIVARLVGVGGESAQEALIKAGLARVFTMPGNATIAYDLFPLEIEARKAKRGLWASEYKIIDAKDAASAKDVYAIVEGAVVSVATVKGASYVNFGEDWKTDFTLTMEPKLAKELSIEDWEGKTVRARGWIYEHNGPVIAVTHPQQIELNP
jgi:micrococcal nuclease